LERWATDVKELDTVDAMGSVLLKLIYADSAQSIVELDEGLLLIVLAHGRAHLSVAGCSAASVKELLSRVRALLPAKVATSDAVSITFLGSEFETSRSLVVPTWDDIKKNYPASVEEKLTALIDRGSKQGRPTASVARPAGNGKDLRPAGTGETVARLVRYALHPRSREVLRSQYRLHDGQRTWN
jgi:hypothetical protein